MQVKIYVCPSRDCANYYASSSQSRLDLSEEMQEGIVENRIIPMDQPDGGKRKPPKHSRAQCPDCRDRGRMVDRVAVVIDVPVPVLALQ